MRRNRKTARNVAMAVVLAVAMVLPLPASSPAGGLLPALSGLFRDVPVQNQSMLFGPTPSPQATRGPYSPAPYRDDEFPQELKDIRRAEVIALGAVPITYLFSSIFYDIGRYAWHVATESPEASSKIPFSTSSTRFDSDEVAGLLITSVIIGGVIALLDNIIITDSRLKEKAERQRLEKLRAEREVQLVPPMPATSPSPDDGQGNSPAPGATTPYPAEASASQTDLQESLPPPGATPSGP